MTRDLTPTRADLWRLVERYGSQALTVERNIEVTDLTPRAEIDAFIDDLDARIQEHIHPA